METKLVPLTANVNYNSASDPLTGPRYDMERIQLSLIDNWHGKFGHLNVVILDHDSVITHYGKHDRVMACCSQGKNLYCRVDSVWSLGEPSTKEILDVARKTQGVKGYWHLVKREVWEDGKHIDYHFEN